MPNETTKVTPKEILAEFDSMCDRLKEFGRFGRYQAIAQEIRTNLIKKGKLEKTMRQLIRMAKHAHDYGKDYDAWKVVRKIRDFGEEK